MQAYLKELNPNQLKAVTSNSKKILVIAGAGSGKTKVLTSRIKYLLDNGASETEIVAFTFTNKAANEMKTRLNKLLNRETNVFISTFHSFCYKDIPFYGYKFGYRDYPKVLTLEQRSQILRDILKRLNLHISNTNFFNYIAKIKNNAEVNIKTEEAILLNKIYHIYQEELLKSNSLDFDDMIPLFLRFLQSNDELALIKKEQAKNILIDEFQDTNQIQYDLIKELASINQNVFMVADDDQLIYSFRNSNISILEDIKANAQEVIILNQNYRCAKNILKLANQLIENNTNRIKKELFSNIEEKAQVRFKEFDDAYEESKMVAQLIKALIKKGYDYNDIAILYRNNNQSYLIEKELSAITLPYKVFGSTPFIENPEIIHIVSIYRLILDPTDLISFNAVCVNGIYGIETFAKEGFLKQYNQVNNLFDEMINYNHYSIKELGKILKQLFIDINNLSSEQFFMRLLEMFKYKEYINNTTNKKVKYDRIMVLKDYIINTHINQYLKLFTELSLNTEVDTKGNYISLLTIHKSKGLEFKCVILIGCNEGIIPPNNITKQSKDEERRLLYVSITRAREILYITSASKHYINGNSKRMIQSSFLLEIIE